MWWADGLCTDNSEVGATAVSKHGSEWRSHCSIVDTGDVVVIGAELWGMGLVLNETINKWVTLPGH
jgi:hypothetical protein